MPLKPKPAKDKAAKDKAAKDKAANGAPAKRKSPQRKLDDFLGDEARFIKSWFDHPLKTGAVTPSGRALARVMASYVDPRVAGPVIELGPGTGPVTDALIARGIAPERLVLVEYDANFCELLKRRFPAATIIQGDAYALAQTLRHLPPAPAAAIVSSLPLLTKPERERVRLLREAFALARPDAPFIQFTYGLVPPIPRKLSGADFAFKAEGSPPVWLNLPPAKVWVYRRARPPQHLPDGIVATLSADKPKFEFLRNIGRRLDGR